MLTKEALARNKQGRFLILRNDKILHYRIFSMYSLIAIFVVIPLYFSHILAPVGVIIGETSSFERQKVYLFFFLILMALIELVWTHGDEVWKRLKQFGGYLVGFLLFPFLSVLLWSTSLDGSFWFGSYEKHHGYLFFVGLALLLFFVQILSDVEKKKLTRASLVSGVLVSFVALLEYLGISLFFGGIQGISWGSGRSIGTLGNPNYLAGYLLMLLPLAQTIRKPERSVIIILFVLAILSTQSLVAIFLLLLYGVWTGLRKGRKQSRFVSGISIFLIGIALIIFGYLFLPSEKLLSLTSRFVLMKETLTFMVEYPLSFFIGFGPDTIVRAYDGARSTLIDSYFPSGSAIDSSHNIFIDFLFQFGIVPLVALGYFLIQSWNRVSSLGKEGFLLGVAFLSLNPYVLVHLIFLIFLFSLHDRKNTSH